MNIGSLIFVTLFSHDYKIMTLVVRLVINEYQIVPSVPDVRDSVKPFSNKCENPPHFAAITL